MTKHLRDALERRIEIRENHLFSLRGEQSRISREIAKAQEELREMQEETKRLKRLDQPIFVTDHAIVRYFERVLGVDILAIQSKIFPQSYAPLARELSATSIPICDEAGVQSHLAKIRDGRVVTVMLS